MSLFRNESPNLGPLTTVNETALTSTSATATGISDFKPTTREVIQVAITATSTTGWVFIAPWKCQVKAIRFVCTTVANSTQTLSVYGNPSASLPQTPQSGNLLTAAAIPVGSGATANTPASLALTTTVANTILSPGDAIGFNGSAAFTSLVGGILQIEVAQIG